MTGCFEIIIRILLFQINICEIRAICGRIILTAKDAKDLFLKLSVETKANKSF